MTATCALDNLITVTSHWRHPPGPRAAAAGRAVRRSRHCDSLAASDNPAAIPPLSQDDHYARQDGD